MAPVKSAKLSVPQASSSKVKFEGKQRSKFKAQKANQNADSAAVPGVQKIKAALRQTRRLLAKDKLAADVRVNTERRLKALEAELVEAEKAKKERALALRYHKIKFFERRKVTRNLNQTKRQLEVCTEKKERKKLEKHLKGLRVDLNYILHYPKLKKYISLFPPEVRQSSKDDEALDIRKDGDAAQESSQTDVQREEIRQGIRERMERGELSAEPEVEDRQSRVTKRRQDTIQPHEKATNSSGPKHMPSIQDDAFFGEESDGHETDTGTERYGSETGMDES